jgi:hypothetical protein
MRGVLVVSLNNLLRTSFSSNLIGLYGLRHGKMRWSCPRRLFVASMVNHTWATIQRKMCREETSVKVLYLWQGEYEAADSRCCFSSNRSWVCKWLSYLVDTSARDNFDTQPHYATSSHTIGDRTRQSGWNVLIKRRCYITRSSSLSAGPWLNGCFRRAITVLRKPLFLAT